MANVPYKTYLTEQEMPHQWYNMRADMKEQHDPYLNPGTLKPMKAEELYPVFAKKLADFEMDETTRYIDIPDEVVDFYRTFRPSPLIRAYHLERILDTRPSSISNLKETTLPAATSSTPPPPWPTMPKSKD